MASSQEIDALMVNVRQLSEELANERKARQDEKDKGISILRLHIPFLIWFASAGGLIGGGITGGMFYTSTKSHVANEKIHLDYKTAEANGGLAYKRDVADAASVYDTNARAALRVIVKSSPLKCDPSPTGTGRKTARCAFLDQETPTR